MREKGVEVVYEDALIHGRVVAVALHGGVQQELISELHPDEQSHAATLAPLRRATWVGGRWALRRGLRAFGLDPGPVFSTDRGAPRLPETVRGSVSHKEEIAVALLCPGGPFQVGVDIERNREPRSDIASLVLTPRERERLAGGSARSGPHRTLLAFSIKEAIYKAIDPYLRRYVGFHEMEVTPREDGTVDVCPCLASGSMELSIEARWVTFDSWILSTAKAWPTSD